MGQSERQNEKFLMMTEAPVERLVCKLAVPTIVSMLISALYNMADTYFVGRIGTSATAAVGVVFSLMAVIQAMGFFFGHGSGNYIARLLGAQKMEEAQKMAAVGFFSAFFAGIVFAAAGLLFLEPFARLLGATETMLPYACAYLRYVLIGMPWMAGSLVLNNVLRFQGNAVYGMAGMTAGAVLNIFLDPVFIFVFGMGVSGAALATMVSQLVGCAILLYGCTRGDNIRIRIRNFSPTARAYREILRGGSPSLFRQGLASIAILLTNHQAAVFGDAAIAAISIVSRTMQFAGSALIGFGQGFQPVCGFNFGAQRYDRVRRAFWFCLKVSCVALLVLAVAGFAAAPSLVSVFRRDDAEVIRIGTLALRMQCVTFPLLGWVIICSMLTQTIGFAARASLVSVARQGLFFIPALMILVPAFGLLGIQLSQPVADLGAFLLSLPIGLGVLRELKQRECAPASGRDSAAGEQAR